MKKKDDFKISLVGESSKLNKRKTNPKDVGKTSIVMRYTMDILKNYKISRKAYFSGYFRRSRIPHDRNVNKKNESDCNLM